MIHALTNDSDPDGEAVVEIGTILAAGLQRLSARKSSRLSSRGEDNPLDCSRIIDGHVMQSRLESPP
jgi:hypothetical protein